jgi:hypothetical protein
MPVLVYLRAVLQHRSVLDLLLAFSLLGSAATAFAECACDVGAGIVDHSV